MLQTEQNIQALNKTYVYTLFRQNTGFIQTMHNLRIMQLLCYPDLPLKATTSTTSSTFTATGHSCISTSWRDVSSAGTASDLAPDVRFVTRDPSTFPSMISTRPILSQRPTDENVHQSSFSVQVTSQIHTRGWRGNLQCQWPAKPPDNTPSSRVVCGAVYPQRLWGSLFSLPVATLPCRVLSGVFQHFAPY